MKKRLALALVAIMLGTSLIGFAVTQEEYDLVLSQRDALYKQLVDAGVKPYVTTEEPKAEATAAPAAPASGAEAKALPSTDEYTVTHEYRWTTSWGSYYWGVVIKNTSGKTMDFTAQVILYDDKNEMIGVNNPMVSTCADGHEMLLLMSNDTAFDHVEYSITPSESNTEYYKEAQTSVTVSAKKVGDKAIIIGKNSGTVAAEYIRYTAIFLKNDQVVNIGMSYLTDNDSQIKPGKSEMREERCSEDFDSVVVYMEGRLAN